MLSEENEPSTFTISDVELESGPETSVEAQKCEFCNSNKPNWRGGPAVKANLCNTCDLRWNGKNKEGCQANQLEGEEIYQLDCRNGEAVPFVSEHSYDGERDFNTRGDGSGYSSFDEGAGRLAHEEYGEGENLSSDGGEGNEWEEDYGKLSNELSMEDEESDDRLESHASAEEGDDEAFLGVVKMESGKENYYCKYCDTSWPYSHFRNAQQFGAHCSNCSRKRKVKDPQELTIRERNKRLRKAKKVSPLHHDKRSHPRGSSSDQSEVRSDGESMSSEEDFDNAALSFLQRAVSTAKTDHREKNSGGFKKTSRASLHAVRKRKFEDFTDSSAAEDKELFSDHHRTSPRSSSRNSIPRSQGHPKRNKHNEGKKVTTKSKKVKAMVIITPEKQDDQSSIAADPNSLGGLLGAIERKLTAEKKKREMTNMKQNIWAMRQEVSEQFDSSLEDLRFRSVALVQELRVDMIAKLEALKIDLASELSFRESRRKKRLNEMRIQMNALNRILESGKKERENGVLLSTFGGKFDTALKQLEDLKVNLQKEFTTREQAMQHQFTEMRASCSLHLANIKQQMHDELNMREGRMQKELEDMKNKLHSVCSQIGAENYCPESPPMPAHSPTPVLPTPEKFTTTTTTTTTTTITHTNINTNSPLGLSLVASLRPMVPHLSGLKPAGPAKQLPSDLPNLSPAVGQKAAAAQQNLPFECLPGLSGATSLEC